MFNLDGMISKVCLLAQDAGDDKRVEKLHAAGLQALSSLVRTFLWRSFSFNVHREHVIIVCFFYERRCGLWESFLTFLQNSIM